jgi:hypothetical protein
VAIAKLNNPNASAAEANLLKNLWTNVTITNSSKGLRTKKMEA